MLLLRKCRVFPFEIIVFLVLLAASAAGSRCASAGVVRKIREAKPDAILSWIHRQTRVDFVSEVLLQSKVIRERPLPVSHTLRFLGFCAFALITLNHFATGVNLAFLSREGGLADAIFISRRCLRGGGRLDRRTIRAAFSGKTALARR